VARAVRAEEQDDFDGYPDMRMAPPLAQLAPSAVRRRVIFVNRYFYPDISATSQMLTDLTRSLSAAGDYELHVICSRRLYADPRARLAPAGEWQGVQIHRCWSAHLGHRLLFWRALDYLCFFMSSTVAMTRWARRGDILVAMTDPPLISVCAALVAKIRRAKLVNWLQDIFPEVATVLNMRIPAWMAGNLRRARTWSLRAAESNVVLGHRMHQRVSGLGALAGKQRVIENWADGGAINPRPALDSALRRSLCAQDTFIVQYSGNLGRAHEILTILGAATRLRHEAGWLFLFVGGGANMKLLQDAARRSNLSNMRFMPYQPRELLADCLSAADAHVTCLLPAMEGLVMPSKFYGILAAGRPVIIIGDPDGEQARVVRAEGCGVIIERGDSKALVDELRRMRANPQWMRDAAHGARALFERRYTLQRAAAQWSQLLESLVDTDAARLTPEALERDGAIHET
jgi:glycosyltransferase involved in cell wall biosynthesis